MVGSSVLAAAQPPPGQSARLFGVHDLSGTSIEHLEGATDSCDKGWITHLVYLDGGSHAITPPAGISLIQRLDWSGSQSAPQDAAQRGPYADRFVETVQRSPDVHVWIVGNEPNFTIWGPLSPLSAYIEPYIEPFVDAYARIRDRVHALPGHANDLVLLPAPSPWSPCFLEGFARIIRGIDARGVTLDGFAIHPGTRHPNDTQRAERVRSDARVGGNCEVGPYGESFDQYRVFRDFIRVVDDNGHASKPIFITESAQNTDDPNAVNHVDEDRGFFAAMYEEVAAWNASNGNRIRALTPYRWERFGDGTARDHSITGKPSLQADHRRGASHTWTSVSCEPTPGRCRTDGECAASELCHEGVCVSAPPCPCAEGRICRYDANVCVPSVRGEATITFSPAMPEPGATVRVDVSSPTGYTNIGLAWEGPLGVGGAPAATLVDITEGFHWLYDAQAPSAGTYRATFTADPAGTVYAIGYLNVGAPPADAGAGAGVDGGATPSVDGGTAVDGSADPSRPPGALDSGCGCRVGLGGASDLGLLVLALLGLRRRRARLDHDSEP
ncbi:MAG: hypothetical protein KF901_20395 [Myxococcales bacterium]|nr:hypothetical protein [Myxococcales bacterium]